MSKELDYVVVEATTVSELEKKVNDRMAFGYEPTETPIVIHNFGGATGIVYFQTMVKG